GRAPQRRGPGPPATPGEGLAWMGEYGGASGPTGRGGAALSKLLRRGRLHAGRLPGGASLVRRRPQPEPEPGRASDGTDERECEQENGRGESDPELAHVARRPRSLAERLVPQAHQPHHPPA